MGKEQDNDILGQNSFEQNFKKWTFSHFAV